MCIDGYFIKEKKKEMSTRTKNPKKWRKKERGVTNEKEINTKKNVKWKKWWKKKKKTEWGEVTEGKKKV